MASKIKCGMSPAVSPLVDLVNKNSPASKDLDGEAEYDDYYSGDEDVLEQEYEDDEEEEEEERQPPKEELEYIFFTFSILEEEDQRGVAHIIDHLAFSATRRYTNHNIVKFLESIGAEFRPCQNAMTSADETIYELFVPVDKPELLSHAISILAEFSSEVRLSKEDLNKERGDVRKI